jgi:hypothetical protein
MAGVTTPNIAASLDKRDVFDGQPTLALGTSPPAVKAATVRLRQRGVP